jgi:hypothetical protein
MITGALLLSFCVFALGTYLVWPSRWNLNAHWNAAFALVAYFVPLFLTDILEQFDPDVIWIFALVMTLGAMFYLWGLLVGAGLPRFSAWQLPLSFARMNEIKFLHFASRRTMLLAVLSLLGVYCSFAAMGFVPMFAASPMEAKYFHGEYREPYHRVAVLYRISFDGVITLSPLLLALWYETRSKSYLGVVGAGIIAGLLALQRGYTGTALIFGCGLLAAQKGGWAFRLYFVSMIVLVMAGTAANDALALLFGNEDFSGRVLGPSESTVWNFLSAPDLPEGLHFFSNFLAHPAYTYGRTFVGGLVPFQYKWNPGLWALSVLLATPEVQDASGGGLRLPLPIWGYSAFGWPGAAAVSLLGGLLIGYIAASARRYIGMASIVRSAVAFLLFQSLLSIAENFPAVTLHSFGPLFVMLPLVYNVSFLVRAGHPRSQHTEAFAW